MAQKQQRLRAAMKRNFWWLKEAKPQFERYAYRLQRLTTGAKQFSSGTPNVVLLSIDSLAARHLGCYGYARRTSPNLDRLAESGVLFERVMSQTNWTKPALASLLTSLHCSVHKADFVTDTGDRSDPSARRQANVLDERFRTLAQHFKQAGYATIGLSDGGYAHSCFGFARGFDVYDDFAGGLKSCGYRLLRWILRQSGNPFFAFLHCWDVHYPYLDRPPYNRLFVQHRVPIVLDSQTRLAINSGARETGDAEIQFLKALYDGAIRYVDDQLNRLLQEFDRLGLKSNTIFAITADHGEAFMEHRTVEHTECLYDEVLHVPLILFGPGIERGRRVRAQVRSIDITPTLLQLCGLVPNTELQGISLLPWIANQRVDDLLSGSETRRRGGIKAVCDGRYKLIYHERERRTEIYDLRNDRIESQDVSGDKALQTAMEAKFQRWQYGNTQFARKYWSTGEEQEKFFIIPEVEERLRALGYVE
jgi:arylsulfatase A-like enzyme